MKKITLFTILFLMLFRISVKADDSLFPYPVAPDDLSSTQDRCSYVVERFWDRCNFKQAMSSKAKLNQAFNDFISLSVLADGSVAHKATEALLEKVKNNPDQLLTFAQMAEGIMYSDTAKVFCEEIYAHYANAVANSKKIKSADKARFATQARILNASQVGMTAPNLEITRTDGTKSHLKDISGAHIILFFNNPDCTDCMLARVRLSADYNINQFIKSGQLQVVSVYPGPADDKEWQSQISMMPDNWIVGSSEDADLVYDMRHTPSIYYLNRDHVIMSKSMTADQLINAFRVINTRTDK
ncbi:MAG: DUF5106 domain-containing protein [Bacteroidales bacterium]|nr:DUF5106 domain-containing protein [Bacteroidales bacterium]